MKVLMPVIALLPFVMYSEDYFSEGNTAYNKGDYKLAKELYDKAFLDHPESPYLYFNSGNALYKMEDYAEARKMYEKASLNGRDAKFGARCRYNIGNCLFKEAVRQSDSDLRKSMEHLENSIRSYREALKLDPELKDAAYNIETARLLYKDILDKLKQQQEKQKEQQEKLKDIIERLKKLIQMQQGLIDESRKLQEKKKKSDEDYSRLAKKQGEIKEESDRISGELNEILSQQKMQGQKSPFEEAKKYVDGAVTDESIAREFLNRHRLEDAARNQESARDNLTRALESLTQKNSQNKSGENNNKNEKKEDKQNQVEQKKQNATAKELIDEEKEERKKRQLQNRGGYQDVDKDW